MPRTNNPAQGYYGHPIDEHGNKLDIHEHEHFFNCKQCGQAVDMRDLGQVFHHEESNHEPLPTH